MLKKCKKHLDSVEESYFQHLKFAFRYSMCCFKAGFMALAHALFPCFFERSASEMVKRLAGCVDAQQERHKFARHKNKLNKKK